MAGTMIDLYYVSSNMTSVSMESGLDGRNNGRGWNPSDPCSPCLNGVRPRWPEQSSLGLDRDYDVNAVSMESGLDGRNNHIAAAHIKRAVQSQWSPA